MCRRWGDEYISRVNESRTLPLFDASVISGEIDLFKELKDFAPFDKYVELSTVSRNGDPITYRVLWDGQFAKCKNCGIKVGWGMSKNKKWVCFELDDPSNLIGSVHFGQCEKKAEPSGVDVL